MKEELNIYTKLSEAKKEVWRRWNDKELREKVEKFLGKKIEKFLKDSPKAYLGRNVASPNFELKYFLDLAKESGLNPSIIEYHSDKFIPENKNKYHLGNMYFFDGISNHKEYKIDAYKIIDFNKSKGKRIKNIKTLWNEKLIDFHHRILSDHLKVKNVVYNDFSSWLKKNGAISKKFYTNYLAIFLCHGILFENYSSKYKGEKKFSLEVVAPSFKKIESIFGIKPLIVPLEPIKDEADLIWYCYPSIVKKKISKLLSDLRNKNKK
jgi:hypothetical protein